MVPSETYFPEIYRVGSMMSALRARRQPRLSGARALRVTGKEYDDNRLRVEATLEEMLPGQDLASSLVDIDDAESDVERPFALAGADLVGEDIAVPVIPKRADEFTCSNCFLIQHVSRLASSQGGQLICIDCA